MMMQISIEWHNLLGSINQFVTQATQYYEEVICFVMDNIKLAIELLMKYYTLIHQRMITIIMLEE